MLLIRHLYSGDRERVYVSCHYDQQHLSHPRTPTSLFSFSAARSALGADAGLHTSTQGDLLILVLIIQPSGPEHSRAALCGQTQPVRWKSTPLGPQVAKLMRIEVGSAGVEQAESRNVPGRDCGSFSGREGG